MNRRGFVARIVMIDGIVLLVVAAVYLALTSSAATWIEPRISPLEKPNIEPVFLFNHIAAGILLLPLALTTLYSAWGVRKGQQWSRLVCLINGLGVLVLPAILYWLMGEQYSGSFVLLLQSVLMIAVGITMLLPVVWFPKDKPQNPDLAGKQHAPA